MKKFFVMWVSQAVSIFGSSIVGFALAWYLTRKTGSATILATAVMVAFIPPIILGPFIGPFIDRWNRKKIMILSDLATMLLTLVLVILFYTKTIQIWHIYVVLVGRSIGGAFQAPAMMAAFTSIVPEKHLTRAYGLNAMLSGILNIVAPPAGAFLMEALPIQWVLSVDIITAVIAVGILLTLIIPQPPRTTLVARANLIGDMMQSFRYLLARRGLVMAFAVAALLNFFCTPPLYMFPMLVNIHLGGDVLKLGWLNSALGVGTILGGALLGVWGGFKKRIHTAFLGVSFLGLGTFALGFTSERLFYFSLVATLILGLSSAVGNSAIPAIVNSIVARDMQGRIFALLGSIGNLMIPLGLAVAGPVADIVGIKWLYWVGGGVFFIIVPLAMLSKSIINIESLKPEEEPAVVSIQSSVNSKQ